MRHEMVLKRTDGKRIKICVMVSVGQGKTQYKTSVECAEKDKRTWVNVTEDNRDFRKLGLTEQVNADLNNQLALVSERELLAAKLEAWQKIKPI